MTSAMENERWELVWIVSEVTQGRLVKRQQCAVHGAIFMLMLRISEAWFKPCQVEKKNQNVILLHQGVKRKV